MIDQEKLHRDGYALLRGAIPAEWLDGLRAAFDAGVKPSDQWPVPRGWGWRHSLLDLDPTVQAVCRLPEVLTVVGALIGERFFLAQVEGREPLRSGGHQKLHRDLSAERLVEKYRHLASFGSLYVMFGMERLADEPKISAILEVARELE